MPDHSALLMLAEWVLIMCLGVVGYVYLGYPLTLRVLPRRPQPSSAPSILPRVTIIIPAFNEAEYIEATLSNKLLQDYPDELLDIIVVSDASTDATEEIVARYEGPRVRLIRQTPRQGKTAALNRAVSSAGADIIVFSDANSHYEPDAVRALVSAFADPAVGYVTGRLEYVNAVNTAVGGGSGLYMRYENWIRRLETRVGSIVGVNGGIDAVRRKLYRPMDPGHLPDLVLPLRVVEQGYRVVFCEAAVAREDALGRHRDEFKMRVRVTLRAMHALYEMRQLLHPRFGLYAFQLWIHKVIRYVLAIPLAVAFVLNAILAARPVYAALLAIQLLCYALALVGWASGGRIRTRPVFVPFYFCLVNAAAGAALIRFLRGHHQVLWTPRKGA